MYIPRLALALSDLCSLKTKGPGMHIQWRTNDKMNALVALATFFFLRLCCFSHTVGNRSFLLSKGKKLVTKDKNGYDQCNASLGINLQSQRRSTVKLF